MHNFIHALIFFILLLHAPLLRANDDLQYIFDHSSPGSQIKIQPGLYSGNFVISKPLKVLGSKKVILDGNGKGTVLKILSKGVSIESLTIRNSGNSIGNEDAGIHVEDSSGFIVKNVNLYDVLYGVRILASPKATISYCTIRGKNYDLGRRGDGIKIWYSPHVTVSNNSIYNVRDVLIWYSDYSKFFKNRVSGNRYGLHYMYSHNNIASDNEIQNNSVGIYDMYSNDLLLTGNKLIGNRGPSGYGFAVKESDRLKILDNIIIGNREGIHMDNSPLQAPNDDTEKTIIQGNTISHNDIGVLFIGQGKWNYLYRNDFNENWQHVSSIDSGRLSAEWQDNYWSNYQGFDLDQDGVGDISYKPISLVDSLMDSKVGFRVFRFSPAMLALQFSERSFPWLAPEPKLIDQTPRLQPYKNQEAKMGSVFSVTFFSMSLLLLGIVLTLFKRVKI